MLSVANNINEAWLSPSRKMEIKINMNGEVYDNEDVTSLSFDSGSISGESFQIGSAYMNQVQLLFPSIIPTVAKDQELTIELGILVEGAYHYSKLGKFIISEFDRSYNDKTTSVTAVDQMILLEGPYESKLKYPARIRDVALEIANLAGVEIDQTSFSVLPTATIQKPIGYTYRQAIGLIAQFEGGFANFNRDGKLQVRRLAPTTFTVTPEQYMMKGFTKNETTYRPNGIVVRTGDEEGDVLRVGSTSGNIIELENKVMTKLLLDSIWSKVKDISYYPFELKWQGNPNLEAGDWFYITDREGNRYSVPNLSFSFTYNGGLSAESKASTSSNSEVTYRYRGSLKQQIEEIKGVLEGANGWNSNYYDSETEPPNPKLGDLWFKKNGVDNEIWIYREVDGVAKWDFEISTAPNQDLLDAIQAAIDASNAAKQAGIEAKEAGERAENLANQAKEDVALVKKTADDGLAKAEEAIARAGFLSNAVDIATEQSAEAVTKARDALASANELLGRVDTVEESVKTISTTVDEVNQELTTKVSETTFNTLKGTVDTHTNQININTRGIGLKADKTYVDTINNQVDSIHTELGVQAGAITSLNSVTDGHTTELQNLTISANSMRNTISKVETDLSNLDLSDRNLLPQSDFATADSVSGWVADGVTMEWSTAKAMKIVFTKTTSYNRVYFKKNILSNLQTGEKYSVSFKAYSNWSSTIQVGGWGNLSGNVYITSRSTDSEDAKYYTVEGLTKGVSNTLSIVGTNGSPTFELYITDIMVVKGNKARPHQLALEDLTTVKQFSDFQQTVEGFMTTVQNDKADKTTVNQLATQWQTTTNLVDGHTSQISSLGEQVSVRVSKDDIVNQINLSTEGILIAGSKVHVTGQTTIDNAVIATAHIKDLAVSTAKIANLAVSGAKIADAAITSAKIGDAAIVNAKIADGAINNAKIQDASISSAKIISLDANKINANDLRAISTKTGALEVSGVLTMSSDNSLILGSYDYGDAPDVYNPRWFSGDFQLGRRMLFFQGDIYNLTSTGAKNTYQYTTGSIYGPDHFKMRSWKSRNMSNSNVRSRIDITSDRIEISDNFNPNATRAYIQSNGHGYFENVATGMINAGSNYNTLKFNSEWRNFLGTITLTSSENGVWINDNTGVGNAQMNFGRDSAGSRIWSMDLYNRTYSGNAAVIITPAGTLGRQTSARKYKLDIQPANQVVTNAKKVLSITPVSWIDKRASERGEVKGRDYGFIADDFDEIGLKEVVIYGADGQVESLAYDRISMYHNVILTEHEKEIQALKNEVKELKNQIQVLQMAV